MNIDEADLLALGHQVVHSFLGGLGCGTHEDDDPFSVRGTIVIEEFVFPASELADLSHVVFHSGGNGLDLLVAGLTALKKDVRVYGGAAGDRMFRIQGVLAESPQGVHVHQRAEILIVPRLDLLDLMGGAETVKEMEEGHPAVDSGQVRHSPQIHDLLRGGGGQQGKACLADAHDITVVTENGQCMGAKGAGRHMEHTWQHLAGDLIHIRDHQQQPLGGGVSSGQGTGLQGTMDRTGRPTLGLHLHHLYRLAEEVLFTVSRPGIHMFRHGRGWGDWEDASHLGKSIGYICRRLIAVHDHDFLLHIYRP